MAKKSSITTTAITDGQRKQYKRFVEDAADRALTEANLDKEGIQRLIENGDEFQARIVKAVKELSISNQFANEEISSSYAYPDSCKIKGIAEQIEILARFFPELEGLSFDSSPVVNSSLPQNAEGWFAIPRWEKLGSTYNKAVDKVLETIAFSRTFYKYCKGQMGPKHLRQISKTVKAFQKLGDEHKEDGVFIVPCQFGLRYRGKSVRRAREIMNANEFGLGAFAVGCMLLTHPEREVQWEQLHVDCAGDEFSDEADGVFDKSPRFYFNGGRLKFDTSFVDIAVDDCGSASGFLPQ